MPKQPPSLQRARGVALLLMVLALAMAFTALFLTSTSKNQIQVRSEKDTLNALAAAKLALIEWSISQTFTGNLNQGRPGELLCPDLHTPGHADEGKSGSDDGNQTCQSNARRLGRIPRFPLGLTQYRDGSGEPLWYMVSAPFQDSENAAGSSINSGTPAALRAFSNAGRTTLTSVSDQAVAVIFAPGAVVGTQNRNSAAQQTAAANYLDRVTAANATAAFNNASNNPANARLDGPISNAAGRLLLNDRLVVITQSEIMNRVKQRAIREYEAALINATPPASCTIGLPPPSVSKAPAFAAVNWLNLNGWEAVLSYASCSPIKLQ